MRLASGQPFSGPPSRARQAAVPARCRRPPTRRCKVLASCLEQVLGNASEIAAGSSGDEHVHQLRVGIRRWRTASRDTRRAALGSGPGRAIGRMRWSTYSGSWAAIGIIATSPVACEPRVERARGPMVRHAATRQAMSPTPGAVVRSPEFQDALLGLVALARRDALPRAATRVRRKPRQAAATEPGQAASGSASATAGGSQELDTDAAASRAQADQAAALPGRIPGTAASATQDAQAFLARLRPVQDALGLYNDELMALRGVPSHGGERPERLVRQLAGSAPGTQPNAAFVPENHARVRQGAAVLGLRPEARAKRHVMPDLIRHP